MSYVQGGIAEAWKDNLLDELAKGELECHDLTKWTKLFLSFLFLDLLYRDGVQESIM